MFSFTVKLEEDNEFLKSVVANLQDEVGTYACRVSDDFSCKTSHS